MLSRLRRAWSSLSMRGLDASDRTESRAVMGANNFYILTALANLPWAIVIMAHNSWTFVLPGVTHLAMIAVWVTALVVNKRGYTPWMSALSIVAAIAQYTFLTDVFSRSAGFQFALFGMPALAFAMFVRRHGRFRAAMILLATILAVWVYLDGAFANPWVPVSDTWLHWSAAMMVVSVMILLMSQAAFADYYFNRERKRNSALLAEARIAAHTDALTHLLNRRGISPCLDEATEAGQFCVALADLDRFKRVNDVLGHGAGDVVLASVAATLEDSIGGLGSVARWGGEEFLIVMPGLSLADGEAALERARIDLEERFREDLEGSSVTMSVGVIAAPQDAARDEVLRQVDAKLYEAKASGRNMVVAGALA
ncbi:GGDEF domain-containing protein [Demequina aurantiaca]|uniref:GGDEF domain-containing protein n=1 Tax=Demequina aurantiaca TaxID=676200 RepID=UPI0007809D43|nr:diguanylate cyclase [Demequina aurantiaca]